MKTTLCSPKPIITFWNGFSFGSYRSCCFGSTCSCFRRSDFSHCVAWIEIWCRALIPFVCRDVPKDGDRSKRYHGPSSRKHESPVYGRDTYSPHYGRDSDGSFYGGNIRSASSSFFSTDTLLSENPSKMTNKIFLRSVKGPSGRFKRQTRNIASDDTSVSKEGISSWEEAIGSIRHRRKTSGKAQEVSYRTFNQTQCP